MATGFDNPSAVDVLNHEIRTPLALVVAHAELLGEMGLGGPAAVSIDVITAAAARLTEVAEALSMTADGGGIDAQWLQFRRHPERLR